MKKTILIVFLTLFLLLFCSCKGQGQLALARQNQDKVFHLPNFEGEKSLQFNNLVRDKMLLFCAVFEEVNKMGLPFYAKYSLSNSKDNGTKVLDVTLKNAQNDADLIAYKMHINLKNKSVDYDSPELEQMAADKTYLYNYLFLRLMNVGLKPLPKREPVTRAMWYSMLASAYEALCGAEINCDAIDPKLTDNVQLKKALEIGVMDIPNLEKADEPISREDAIISYLSFVEYAEQKLYGVASQTAILEQAQNLFSVISKMQGRDIDTLIAAGKGEQNKKNTLLTRLELAKMLVPAFEEYISPVSVMHNRTKFFSDTKSTYANKAVSCGVMKYYANNNTFMPDKEVAFWEMIQPFKNFVESSKKHLKKNKDPFDFSKAISLLSQGMAPFLNRQKVKSLDVVVVNERPYDWYTNQLETGEYAAVNCVPSCVKMAAVWKNPDSTVTVEKLRERIPANGIGWSGKQLVLALRENGINPIERNPATISGIKEDLDNGCIIIIMYNEGGANEGHAVVIKGYRQSAAGLWFILNDPFSLKNDKYAKPCGQSREMEGKHLEFVCSRFTDTYFVITP